MLCSPTKRTMARPTPSPPTAVERWRIGCGLTIPAGQNPFDRCTGIPGRATSKPRRGSRYRLPSLLSIIEPVAGTGCIVNTPMNNVILGRDAPTASRPGPVGLFGQPHHRDTQGQIVNGCKCGGASWH